MNPYEILYMIVLLYSIPNKQVCMTNMSRRRRISLVDLPILSRGLLIVKSSIHKKDFVDFDHGAPYYIFNTNYDPESGMFSGARNRRF